MIRSNARDENRHGPAFGQAAEGAFRSLTALCSLRLFRRRTLPAGRGCAKEDLVLASLVNAVPAPGYTGSGWELAIERLGLHVSGAKTRTYSRYQAYHSGKAQPHLSGYMCEANGPGDNANEGSGRRVAPGRYPIWTQFGRYRSIGYGLETATPGVGPMPAFRLAETGKRTDILVHPAHPPDLFLISVGCFNPTSPLGPAGLMDYWDSRGRVIALLDDLHAHAPRAFDQEVMTPVADAWVVVTGEPMNVLPATREVV